VSASVDRIHESVCTLVMASVHLHARRRVEYTRLELNGTEHGYQSMWGLDSRLDLTHIVRGKRLGGWPSYLFGSRTDMIRWASQSWACEPALVYATDRYPRRRGK
jgi:hypothetical protein